MKKIIGIVMVLMMVLGLMIPVLGSAASAKDVKNVDYMWVNCEDGKTLNVRESASKSAKVLYRVECGTKLTVLGAVDGTKDWAYVQKDGKSAGYVMTKFLVFEKPGKYEITERDTDFKSVKSYKVTALPRSKNSTESVGLRTKPNKTAKAIRRLAAGDTLTVIAVGKTWSQVKDPETGKTGYVANDYITKK